MSVESLLRCTALHKLLKYTAIRCKKSKHFQVGNPMGKEHITHEIQMHKQATGRTGMRYNATKGATEGDAAHHDKAQMREL